MMVRVLAMGFLLFAASFALHWILWTTRRPVKEIFWLITLFVIVPLGALCFGVAFGLLGLTEAAAIGLLDLAFSGVYIQSYPAIKTDIPSFCILTAIAQSGERGILPEEIRRVLADERRLISDKLDELKGDALIETDGDLVRLKPLGRLVARVYLCYRRILGLGIGKG